MELAYAHPAFALLWNLSLQCYTSPHDNHSWIQTPAPFHEDYDEVVGWCPRTFDGFACWDWTPPGSVAVKNCPSFIIGFDPTRLAYKTCTVYGNWYVHPETQRPWTNYTTCIDVEDLNFRNIINNIYVAGYSVSSAALVLSMAIFMYFKALHCTRIMIHMNLFLAFAVSGVLWIIWYKTVVNDVTVVQDNKVWCQALHVVTHYFMVSSYMWMFIEGLYLHIALILVFVQEDRAMRWFLSMGWGFSLLLTLTYAAVRYNVPDATSRCWMDYSDTFWILTVPVLISLISSCVFLVNIVRVLVTKMATTNSAPLARKAVHAGLILVPLFGLHFLLMPLRPATGTAAEKVYQVTSALLTSLQGFCVAVLFCFTNQEVSNTARAHVARYMDSHELVAVAGESRIARSDLTTAAESVIYIRESVV